MTLAGGALAIAALGHAAAENFAGTFRMFLEQPDQFAVDSDSIMALMRHAADRPRRSCWPLRLRADDGRWPCAAISCSTARVFAAERIKPDLSKLSLIKGFKRMFGLDGLTNLVKGLIKIADRRRGGVDDAVARARRDRRPCSTFRPIRSRAR